VGDKTWLYASGAALLGALYWLFKPGSASASTKGKCGDWAGDSKAIQSAINDALKAAGRPGIVVDGKPGAMTCRGAEWLRDNKKASKEILAFVNTKVCGCGLKRAPCGIGGPVASQSVKDQIIAAAVAKGYPAADVQKGVSRESGWHAQALNCQGADKHPVAGGLLQFLAATAKSNGFDGNIDQFAGLTAEEQLPYLLSFIKKMPASTLHLPGDFGLALFTPAYVGKPNDFVIYDIGSDGWNQNPGLRTAGGGPITAGSVRKTGE
jgi:hypothetical protein